MVGSRLKVLTALVVASPLHLYVPLRLVRVASDGSDAYYGAPLIYAHHGFDLPTSFNSLAIALNCVIWALLILLTIEIFRAAKRSVWPAFPVYLQIAGFVLLALASASTLVQTSKYTGRWDYLVDKTGAPLNPMATSGHHIGNEVELAVIDVGAVFSNDDAGTPRKSPPVASWRLG